MHTIIPKDKTLLGTWLYVVHLPGGNTERVWGTSTCINEVRRDLIQFDGYPTSIRVTVKESMRFTVQS